MTRKDGSTAVRPAVSAGPAAAQWLLLAGAIASEVTASLSLKGALTEPVLYVLVVAGYATSFTLLALTLRQGMALGAAYGIWGALGVTLTVVLSAVMFGEPVTALMGTGIVLVIVGVIAVELGSQHTPVSARRRPARTGSPATSHRDSALSQGDPAPPEEAR